MKHFLRKYPETILIFLVALFLGIIIWSFVWGVGQVVGEVDRASNTKVDAGTAVGFDLKGAQGLDLRGLVKTQP